MEQMSYEHKLEEFRKMGVDPDRLKARNPQFFENIMTRIKCPSGDQKPLQNVWITCGDPEYAKKIRDIEQRQKQQQRIDSQAQISKKDEIRLQGKPSSKWNSRGKFRKK